MRRLLYLFLSIVLFASMAACEMVGAGNESDAQEERELVGPTWQLVAFEEADGTTVGVEINPEHGDREKFYILDFMSLTETREVDCYREEDNPCLRVTGYPNEGLFTYSANEEGSLTTDFNGTTRVGPPPESKENEFFDALKAATSYQIEGNRLRIAYDDGKALLFEAEASE